MSIFSLIWLIKRMIKDKNEEFFSLILFIMFVFRRWLDCGEQVCASWPHLCLGPKIYSQENWLWQRNQGVRFFFNISCMFLNLNNFFSNLNSNCSNLLDMGNLQEQIKKAFCYQKLFRPLSVGINCFKMCIS